MSLLPLDKFIREGMPIRGCSVCKRIRTDSWTMMVEEKTLRRKRAYICFDCSNRNTWEGHMFYEEQQKLIEKRSLSEIHKITDNSGDEHVDGDKFLEQFGAKSRKIIRSFLKSDFSEATITGISISTINATIITLALEKHLYAETRDDTIVLRRLSS